MTITIQPQPPPFLFFGYKKRICGKLKKLPHILCFVYLNDSAISRLAPWVLHLSSLFRVPSCSVMFAWSFLMQVWICTIATWAGACCAFLTMPSSGQYSIWFSILDASIALARLVFNPYFPYLQIFNKLYFFQFPWRQHKVQLKWEIAETRMPCHQNWRKS